MLQKLIFHRHASDKLEAALPGGLSMYSLCGTNRWIDCGRPRTGAVADCMRRTRAAYHYAIRELKRDEGKMVNERIADSILNNNTRDFWSEIKRIRSNKCGTIVVLLMVKLRALVLLNYSLITIETCIPVCRTILRNLTVFKLRLNNY
jgi:hypothetical protein